MLQTTAGSQYGMILLYMQRNRSQWLSGVDFLRDGSTIPFIGYKAPTRLSELQKKGIIISRWSDQTFANGSKFKEYKLKASVVIQFDGAYVWANRVDQRISGMPIAPMESELSVSEPAMTEEQKGSWIKNLFSGK